MNFSRKIRRSEESGQNYVRAIFALAECRLHLVGLHPASMNRITPLLQKLLQGRNLAEVARETGVNHVKIWRIATGKQFADLRTGEAEDVYEFLTKEPLIEERDPA